MKENTDLLIEYAKKYIPFYGHKQLANITRMAELPLINKTMIMNDYSAFVSEENMKKKKLIMEYFDNYISHTRGITNEIGVIEDIVIEETSGTSGVPFLCAKSIRERTMISMELYKQRKQRDKDFSPRHFFSYSHIGLGAYDPQAYNYNINNLENLYKVIQEKNVRWIHASPNCIINHIDLLEQNNINVNIDSLKFIECNGSYLSINDKIRIEKFFNVKVINHYGCIETWPIALSCEKNNMHINESVTFLEIVDENGDTISESNKIGRVVVTTLINRFFPLIRYLLGDFGMYLDEPCECKDAGRVIRLVEGREANIIKGLPNIVFGNTVFRRLIGEVKLKYPLLKLTYIQIIQDQTQHLWVYINYFELNKLFVQEIIDLLYREVRVRYEYDILVLNETEILEKQKEKPNLFLCKMK